MKRTLYVALLLILIGCADKYEDSHRYSRWVTQTKNYPIYLDMSEVTNIQVKRSGALEQPFKIVFNDRYYFVGEMMKGIHVYEKKEKSKPDYLCFIECKYLKDLDITGNYLFCNNLVDLVVLNVGTPTQTTVQHREKYHFNKFEGNAASWNIPYDYNKGCVVDYLPQVLSGYVTEKQLELDFSEYDRLYENLSTKDLPASWISDNPMNDKPWLGITKAGDNQIYTFGNNENWTINSYSGSFNTYQTEWRVTPFGSYMCPVYSNDSHFVRLLNKEGTLYLLGIGNDSSSGYFDCMTSPKPYSLWFNFRFSNNVPVDITFIASLKRFFILSDGFIRSALIKDDFPEGVVNYSDYEIVSGATAMISAQDKLITLGNKLTVYHPAETSIQLVKEYLHISGSCMLKEENLLAVANQQGLSLYDISNLENITLIP